MAIPALEPATLHLMQPNQDADLIQPDSFTMKGNPNSIEGVQASETFMVTAKGNSALTPEGLQIGFAKYKFDGEALDKAAKNLDQAQNFKDVCNREINGLKNTAQALTEANQKLDDHNTGKNALDGATLQSVKDDVARLEGEMPRKAQAALAAVKKATPIMPEAVPEGLSADNPAKLVEELSTIQNNLSTLELEAGALQSKLNKVAAPAGFLYGDKTPPADRALLARQVASYEVDQALGIGVIAPEKFGKDELGKPIGISMQADGAGVTGLNDGKDSFLKVDFSDPNVQRGFSDLQAMDYITGQIDRHAGNMFVDATSGKVTGIDNDLAFPEVSRQDMIKTRGDFVSKVCKGPPGTMHQETADKLLKADPEELRTRLKNMPVPEGASKLSDAAINGAVDRLKEVQSQIKKGQIKVVPEFDKNTYEAAMKAESKSQGCKDLRKLQKQDFDSNISLGGGIKTSYIAAAALQVQKYEAFGKTELKNTGLAQRNPEGIKLMADQTAGKIASAQQDLEKHQEHLGKVSQGGVKGISARVQHGSADAINKKIEVTSKQLASLEKQTDRIMQVADHDTALEVAPKLGRNPPVAPKVEADGPRVKVGEALHQKNANKPSVPKLDLGSAKPTNMRY
jgi:hypothetical protein